MSNKVGICILAAGLGTRMKLDLPKGLAPLSGKKMIDFPLSEAMKFTRNADLEGLFGIVTGSQRELVENYLKNQNSLKNIKFAFQKEQKGTADALKSYFSEISEAEKMDYTVILCADTPLIREHHLTQLFSDLKENNLDGVAAVFETKKPTGYGRIIEGSPGFHIVEEKDASGEQRKVETVNAALYIIKTKFILENLKNIDSKNKSGEFYLTDLFKDEFNVKAIYFEDGNSFLGVNTLEQLSDVDHNIRMEKAKMLSKNGVIIRDRRHVYIDYDVVIGAGTEVAPQVHIDKNSKIGKNVILEAGAIIKNSHIKDGAHIKAYSYITDSVVGESASIGPFAHLRPGSDIGAECKIGNFVETKKSKLDKGAKVSHLSYVGDAEIGENTNIGCGFITCNYDGALKHKTVIGKDSFIGSDTQTIAPVNIGDESYIGSGSTITKDVPSGDFAIARAKQVTKEGMAKRFIKKKQ